MKIIWIFYTHHLYFFMSIQCHSSLSPLSLALTLERWPTILRKRNHWCWMEAFSLLLLLEFLFDMALLTSHFFLTASSFRFHYALKLFIDYSQPFSVFSISSHSSYTCLALLTPFHSSLDATLFLVGLSTLVALITPWVLQNCKFPLWTLTSKLSTEFC